MSGSRSGQLSGKRIVAAIIGLIGAIWVGQGLGYIGGSFMTGSPKWAIIGGCAIAIAVVLAWPEARQRPPESHDSE